MIFNLYGTTAKCTTPPAQYHTTNTVDIRSELTPLTRLQEDGIVLPALYPYYPK